MPNMTEQTKSVKEYYSRVLPSKHDLKTNACCSLDSIPEYIRAILNLVDPEILDKFYGCGSPIPFALAGTRVLDLAAGPGGMFLCCPTLSALPGGGCRSIFGPTLSCWANAWPEPCPWKTFAGFCKNMAARITGCASVNLLQFIIRKLTKKSG